ncbi:MAG: protein translocase subunit SecF [Chloroflexi bacterium]|nr:protein translocase subunit SecF [Chloroflexota bacterium]
MFDIIGKRFWFFLVSGIVILSGLIALIAFGLKPGIEFSSGSLLTVGFNQTVTTGQIEQELADAGYHEVIIQRTGQGDFLLRLPELSGNAKSTLEAKLKAGLGDLEVKGFDSVSPMIAVETTRNATIAVIISAVGMLLYISWAFRRMPNPFRWGVCAIASLVHDILVVLGVFAILGRVFNWQIDLMFITGMLTVIGYSVNDTIVIFDRIRENLLKGGGIDFEVVVNNSLIETMSRSLNTGLTTLFAVIALWLFVGAPIQNLVIVLLVGIATGTYSSIGTAASLLVVWRKGEWGRFIGRRHLPTA